MIYADSHSHTVFSHDASKNGATHITNCRAAIDAGLSYLAFTEHYDMDDILSGRYPETDIPGSRKSAQEATEMFKGKLTAVYGIELGDPISHPEESVAFLKKNNFGFVIGSVHSSRRDCDFFGIDFDSLGDDYLRLLWTEYLEDLYSHVKWACSGETNYFDTLAHITYPCRYYKRHGRGELIDMNEAKEAFAEIFRFIIANGIALECNTSGLHQEINSLLPDESILRLYRDLGGEMITVGSDAHFSKHIGFAVKETYELLSSIGFDYVTVFENRKPEQIKLDK